MPTQSLYHTGSKPTIGILTTFYELDSSYSLCNVVLHQLVALVNHGYKTVLFVHDNFKDEDKVPVGVEVRKVVPRFLLKDYGGISEPDPILREQAEKTYEVLKEELKDIDVVLAHDLIFQGWFLPYCIAIHKVASETEIKWFHWIHSVPTPMPSGTKPPLDLRWKLPRNSKLVYLNNHDVVTVAESYGTFPKDVRVVHNPVDPRIFWDTEPLVTSIINKYGLLDADFVQIYPVSTPRMVEGKGLHKLIEVFAALKKQGKVVRLIVCNAHANDKREKQTIGETQSFASQLGLSPAEVIFTSLEDPKYETGVPHKVISQLFRLSNLFVFPSISENCSLILLEAMLSGNLLVLNKNVQSMREFGGPNALYFEFGSNRESVSYSNGFDKYAEDVARIIISEFSTNKTLRAQVEARKKFNYDFIFNNQIEPLFYENRE